MNTLPAPPPADNRPTPAARCETAFRELHKVQVRAASGEPVSQLLDEAEARYRVAVADHEAARVAQIDAFVAPLRLLNEDETGLREIAARLVCGIVGVLPGNTHEVLEAVVARLQLAERELARICDESRGKFIEHDIELVETDGRLGALAADVRAIRADIERLHAREKVGGGVRS